MTPKEFSDLMKTIFDFGCCKEENHVAAELLMCDILEELGYGEGIEIFKKSVGYED